MMNQIMQIIGLVASLLALVLSLIAFLKANSTKVRVEEFEDQLEELTNDHSEPEESSRKRKRKRKR